jgi:UDP-N-acetylmuramate--alanine ligase
MTRVHLIGIGGAGISAIGTLLIESGYQVSGSDQKISPITRKLQDYGARFYQGHRPENVTGADLVVRSSAIPDENVEVQAALSAGIPVLKRAEFLGRFTGNYQTIAVAGTHGKTTTTAMIAWMLTSLGYDPSYIIGSFAINMDKNAHAGQGSIFVLEADEYDYMFLGLNPSLAVVTNVEHDHLDCFPTYQDYFQSFLDFIDKIDIDGVLIACGDDPGCSDLLIETAATNRTALSYGLGSLMEASSLDYSGQNLKISNNGCYIFDVYQGSSNLVRVSLQVPGVHNVRNSLAAIVIAHTLEIPLRDAARSLGEFQGTGRRFEIVGEAAGIVVIDDYAHHPSEISATLSAARDRYPNRRIWAAWQPHTYSRTIALLRDFVNALRNADCILVTEVYPAREPVRMDFSASRVVQAMKHGNAYFVPDISQACDFLLTHLSPGDALIVMSAGDGNKISSGVFAELQRQEMKNV